MRQLMCLLSITVLVSSTASALSAVIEVNGPQDIDERPPYAAALTSYYAPHAVFFEGWNSAPREVITSYDWDFGDGSDKFYGFNAAHVYETPGTYTVTLTVTAKAEPGETPETATDTVQITVLARDGDTYYVDSDIGSDEYDGLSQTVDGQGGGPWKTATKAFAGASGTEPLFQPGDQVLFKRGQTFDLQIDASTSTFSSNSWGILFGAHGPGDKPLIQAMGEIINDGSLLNPKFVHRRFITLSDLKFNCTADESNVANFWESRQGGTNFLFLRLDIEDFNQGFLSFDAENVFIVDCNTYNSQVTHAYFERGTIGLPSRIAILRTTMDYSGNHVVYGVDPQSAVIHGSTFSRPAFGRCAFRIAGGRPEYGIARNVWFSHNKFLGWMDPRTGDRQYADGKQYNYLLVQFAPSGPENARFGEWLVFEDNLITDAQQMLTVAAWEHVIVRKNQFVTADPTSTAKVRVGHASAYDWRPCYDVQFVENVFEFTNSTASAFVPAICVYPYEGPDYPDRMVHEDIVIARNVFCMPSSNGTRYALFLPEDAGQRQGISSENNIVYAPDGSQSIFGIGSSLGEYATYALSEWQSLTGHDLATQIYEDFDKPVPGWAESPDGDVDSPISVTYERAMAMTPESGTAQAGGADSITLAASSSAQDGRYDGMLLKITGGTGAGQAQVIKDYDGSTKVATFYLPWTTVNHLSWVSPDSTSVYEIEGAGAEIAEVALWARYEDGPWADTGLRTSGTSGSFSYPAAEGAGTYSFATQAIDTAGNVSLPPVGPGATKTYYTGGAPLDTTAPNPGVLSAPASATTSPITVTYTDAADEAGGSGLNEVELWVKKASVGLWNPTGLKQTGSSGSFNYSVSVSGIETFYFDTRAEDNAGNISALPSGDGQASTVFGEVEGDIIPPTAGTVDAPGVTNAAPITVSYSGVTDEGGSGLKQVVLWAKVNGGSWLSTGMTNTAASGNFAYSPEAGDGQYAFALRAEDNAGNLSAAPSGDGVPCLYDATVPTIGSMTSPLYAKATPIAVSYSDVSDGSGSGLRKVYFWFRKDGGAWVDSGLSQTTASGTFNTSPGQAGTYEYALRVEDIAGNLSPQPSGAGLTATILDMAAPVLGTLTAPSEDSSPPISVVYSGVEDDLSGLKLVYLWFRKGAGAWQNSGLAAAAASGSFAFNGMTGNDTYYFALQAEDNAGNLTPAPTGDGAGSTVYDTDFSAGTAASPEYATALPIIVTYSGTTESDNGLKLVRLWYKHGSDGVWTDSGLTSPGLSGQFEFGVISEDGSYYFALQAENNEGGLTPGPPYGDGDTQTIYDTTPPNPGNMASPEYTKETPIVITYSGASDAASGLKEVRLWFKKGYAGAWEDTGQRSTTPEGTFTFTDVTGDDAYFFFLQAEDNAGHLSAEPTDELVFGGG